MTERTSIYIIIPVFNEAGAIGKVLKELVAQGYSEIIIVDDGSTDDLLKVLNDHPVHYLRHAVNLGQGAALQTGFEYACSLNADMAVTFDADGQHLATDIERIIEPLLNNKADIVLGSRFLSARTEGLKFHKKLLLKFATILNLILSGIALTDAHNGIRALNRKSLDLINLKENRMAHASEILFEIRKHQLKFIEVPVTIRYTSYSKHKGQTVLDSIKILFDLVLHKLFK